MGGVCEVGEEGTGCGRLLFDFHLQLLINTIFQIIDVGFLKRHLIVKYL